MASPAFCHLPLLIDCRMFFCLASKCKLLALWCRLRAVECLSQCLPQLPTALHDCCSLPLQSLNNLGVVYTSQGRSQEGLALLQAAIQSCPTYAEAFNNLGVLQRDVGSIRAAIDSYTQCLELCPDSRNAGQNRLLALNYIYHGEEASVCAAHVTWGRQFQRLHKPLPPIVKQVRCGCCFVRSGDIH